jgi:hypothetical protein
VYLKFIIPKILAHGDFHVNTDIALKRQLGVLPNLYQAVLYYVLWVIMRYHLKWLLQCAWKSSRKTQKGSAVKLFQHTQLPFEAFFMQLLGQIFPEG